MCLESEARPVHEAHKFTAILGPILQTMWDP
jgi:hypothetical protein